MFYVNKIVGWIFSPLGLLFLGLALGLAVRRLRWAVWGVTLALFWTLSCGVMTPVLGLPLEGEETPLVDTLELGGCDAVVLLGGGVGSHRECGRAELFSAADRVWEAARLWKTHQNGDMKLAVGGGDTQAATTQVLTELGVDERALVFFSEARNTEEEARLIAASGLKRVRLVTSAWHMPRARRLFERAGLDVIAAPTDYEMHFAAELPLQLKDFFPSADALWRNSVALKEWVARLGYWIREL